MTEEAKLVALTMQGLIVEVIDPSATKFNEKYRAYSDMPLGKRYVVLDENGTIIGRQG